jgi:hypothetical protein
MNKQIEEIKRTLEIAMCQDLPFIDSCELGAKALCEQGYQKVDEGSVVLTREEYEQMKSLYDCQQGAIMTSSIGDLPLTVEGLRKAVDEIERLIRVQVELQELNMEYYNEAKDLRRKLKCLT